MTDQAKITKVNQGLSESIVRWMKTMKYRCRAPVSVRPEEQKDLEPHCSYVCAPGIREWFFDNKTNFNLFLIRHPEAKAI